MPQIVQLIESQSLGCGPSDDKLSQIARDYGFLVRCLVCRQCSGSASSKITFAVSARYRGAGQLVVGLAYIDRLFVTELYFEKMTDSLFNPWHPEWPASHRGRVRGFSHFGHSFGARAEGW